MQKFAPKVFEYILGVIRNWERPKKEFPDISASATNSSTLTNPGPTEVSSIIMAIIIHCSSRNISVLRSIRGN